MIADEDTVRIYGEITIGTDGGGYECSGAVDGTDNISEAVYSHTADISYTIEQVGEMSALFHVNRNSLTLQNVTLKGYQEAVL